MDYQVEVGRTMPQIEDPEGAPEEFVPDPDYEAWTDAEVAALYGKVRNEYRRREAMQQAARTAEQAAEAYRAASGRRPGEPWVEPLSAVDAYPLSWTVTHGGTVWESLVPTNMRAPGDGDTWRAVEPPADEPAPVPEPEAIVAPDSPPPAGEDPLQ